MIELATDWMIQAKKLWN